MSGVDYTDRFFIPHDEAVEVLSSHSSLRSVTAHTLPIQSVLGHIVAEDIYAPISLPGFSQSSFDGYAVRYEDLIHRLPLEINGEIPAGATSEPIFTPNQAQRIYTGAPVPQGADTILLVEYTHTKDGQIIGTSRDVIKGQGVRPRGAEIKESEIALERGTRITAGAIGFLATMGIDHLKVYTKPRVSVLVTGDELATPGTSLSFGQIYEANSYALRGGLEEMNIEPSVVDFAQDNLPALTQQVSDALEQSDILLISGGISMGAYDYTLQALINNGVNVLFHKIKQRPGKPLLAGRQCDDRSEKWVFALPGNPASVLTCYYVYVRPFIDQWMGLIPSNRTSILPLAQEYVNKTALTLFLKGYSDGSQAHILPAQESFRLSSFAKANCLIKIPPHAQIAKGESVSVYLI